MLALGIFKVFPFGPIHSSRFGLVSAMTLQSATHAFVEELEPAPEVKELVFRRKEKRTVKRKRKKRSGDIEEGGAEPIAPDVPQDDPAPDREQDAVQPPSADVSRQGRSGSRERTFFATNGSPLLSVLRFARPPVPLCVDERNANVLIIIFMVGIIIYGVRSYLIPYGLWAQGCL